MGLNYIIEVGNRGNRGRLLRVIIEAIGFIRISGAADFVWLGLVTTNRY